MREPLANPMGNRSLQRVVMKNVLVDKGGKLRLMARHLLRFAADARPDRIHFIEAPSRPRLILSHGPLSPGASRSPNGLLSQFCNRQESFIRALRMAHARWLRRSITPAL